MFKSMLSLSYDTLRNRVYGFVLRNSRYKSIRLSNFGRIGRKVFLKKRELRWEKKIYLLSLIRKSKKRIEKKIGTHRVVKILRQRKKFESWEFQSREDWVHCVSHCKGVVEWNERLVWPASQYQCEQSCLFLIPKWESKVRFQNNYSKRINFREDQW